ncbi:hypothetical protein CLU81_3578 [Flavobacterium sp. 9]|uniref:hypothetical protein n=1 Tax=Flavobacterium sp. 9 TaxID=2035198 RepID=UPI000C6405F1|nr:hypothetical protein [Flavobacterium sp. 9]PIF33008.1 hypothetical protein CLU81_3578 [Flavobacterium sp. 9]
MADKYQYIRDEENEKLRKKLAKINRERNTVITIVLIIAALYFGVVFYLDEIILFLS